MEQLQLFDLALKVVPEYDGNSNSLYRFLNAVNSVVTQYYDVNNEKNFQNVIVVNGIIGKLRGKALEIIDVTAANTWARIKEVLVQNFSDQRDENSLNRDLVNLHQGTESPQQFYDRCVNLLTTLINYINIHNDDSNVITCKRDFFTAQALKTFLAGLKEPLGSTIRAMRPETLPAALQYIKEESNIMYLQKRNLPQNQIVNNKTVNQTSNQHFGSNTQRFPLNWPQQRPNYLNYKQNFQPRNQNFLQNTRPNFNQYRPNQSQQNKPNFFYQNPNTISRQGPTPMSGISYPNLQKNNNGPRFIPNPNPRPQYSNSGQPNYFQNVGHYPDFAFEEVHLHEIENSDFTEQYYPDNFQPEPFPAGDESYLCEIPVQDEAAAYIPENPNFCLAPDITKKT